MNAAPDLTQTLENFIRRAGRVVLFLDFDGTLSPIVARPELVAMEERSRTVLEALTRSSHASIAVVSGRMLSDVKSRVGLPVIYAGNHGLEIEGPDFAFLAPGVENALAAFRFILPELSAQLGSIPETLIENKRLTIGVHFRMVAPAQKAEVQRRVEKICHDYPHAVRLRPGKEVIEIRPIVDWNKGTAARWIRDRLGAREWPTVCAGDDLTDEDMFRELPDAISIKVGEGPTRAGFRVADTREFSEILERVAALLRNMA